jgi:hypothetical protein
MTTKKVVDPLEFITYLYDLVQSYKYRVPSIPPELVNKISAYRLFIIQLSTKYRETILFVNLFSLQLYSLNINPNLEMNPRKESNAIIHSRLVKEELIPCMVDFFKNHPLSFNQLLCCMT